MKKRFFVVLMVLMMGFSLFAAGCGQKVPEAPKQQASGDEQADKDQGQDKKALKAAMATDVGGVHDQSFNQSAWEGLQRAEKELGVEANYIESQQEADYGPNLETLYDAGNDLIWGVGYMMAGAIKEAAEKNPDQNYAIIDFAYGDESPENVVGVVFKAEQASFLVGYIAGKMTKTGKIGFVGGKRGFIIDAFEYGFRAGVKYADKDAEVAIQYADSFTDAAKGKAIANQMYQNGADIVFHAAGGVGLGVIESAKENEKQVIGVDRDQNSLAPDHVITSAMKRVDNGMYNTVKAMAEGKLPVGETVVYGLAEGGVDIAPTSDKHVPAEILDEIATLKQEIIDGKITVPFNEETFNEFKAE